MCWKNITHNFLNIQPIFNSQKVLESWDLGLFNHTIKCYLCRRCQRLFWPSTPPTCFNIHSIWWYGWKDLSLSFPKLFVDWKLVKYWESYEQKCSRPFWASFNTFHIHGITALIVFIDLLSIPLTWLTLLCIESSLCTFDTSDMSKITLYTLLCKSHKHHFQHLWHT